MRKARVLLVDDSVVIRRLVADVLNSDPHIEVAATAANGLQALTKLQQTRVDAIVLDMEMPELDGLGTLREIRKRDRQTPIVMFSALTERGARSTFEALAAGATDYVTKPARMGSIDESRANARLELVPRIRALVRTPTGAVVNTAELPPAQRRTSAALTVVPPAAVAAVPVEATPQPEPAAAPAVAVRAPLRPVPAPPRRQTLAEIHRARVAAGERPTHLAPVIHEREPVLRTRTGIVASPKVLVIGCSTGGPEAAATMLSALPASLGVPVLMVQHMPPMFTRLFAERLNNVSKLTVAQAVSGVELLPNHVYLAPGDFHLEASGRSGASVQTLLHQGPPENFCRPAVDVLFRSATRVYGGGVLAVVLTGMGSDGRAGCAEIVRNGGQVIVQDKPTSVVWGMPGAVAEAGLADAILPLDKIAGEIVSRISPDRSAREKVSGQQALGGSARVPLTREVGSR